MRQRRSLSPSAGDRAALPRLRRIAFAVACAVLLASGAAPAQPRIVTTIPPWVDLLERLAGPEAEVTGLLPAGASPHAFDPTPRQLAEITRADLVVVNGGLDAWALDLVESSGTGATVLTVLELPAVDAIEGGHDHEGEHDRHTDEEHSGEEGHQEHEEHAEEEEHQGHGDHEQHEHGGVNPHVWLDPLRVRALVPALADALIEADPANEMAYRTNAERLRAELAALHDELDAILAPVAGAPFVPFHDAWPYFAERYDLDLVIELEPFPGREPTPRYLAEALDAIRASGARAVFAEAQLGARPAEVVAAEAGISVAVLDPLGGGGELRGYDALLRYNARTIAETLGDD